MDVQVFLQHVSVYSLTPCFVTFDENHSFCNVWAGNYATIARTHQSEHIYVWGLNASGQLGSCNKYTHQFNFFIQIDQKLSLQGSDPPKRCQSPYSHKALWLFHIYITRVGQYVMKYVKEFSFIARQRISCRLVDLMHKNGEKN